MESRYLGAFYRTVTIAGALAVTGLGALLLHAALTTPTYPMPKMLMFIRRLTSRYFAGTAGPSGGL